jgi:hypothetical protein
MGKTIGLAAAAALVLAVAFAASARPRDPLYQWTDSDGVVRYTTEITRIPLGQRGDAVVVAGAHAAAPREKPTAPSAAQPEAAPAPPSAPPDPAVAALDARIAELEKRIAEDEAALADYISDPDRAKPENEPAKGEVAAIADRLPKLQSELRDLKAQRAAAAGAAAPNAP